MPALRMAANLVGPADRGRRSRSRSRSRRPSRGAPESAPPVPRRAAAEAPPGDAPVPRPRRSDRRSRIARPRGASWRLRISALGSRHVALTDPRSRRCSPPPSRRSSRARRRTTPARRRRCRRWRRARAPPAAAPPPAAAATAAAAPAGARSRAPPAAGPGGSITGKIELPAALAKTKPEGTLFLVARRISDNPSVRGTLIAVKKLPATKFPLAFDLSAADMPFQNGAFDGELTLTARIDQDGDPLTPPEGRRASGRCPRCGSDRRTCG